MEWMFFHNLARGTRAASGWLQRLVRSFGLRWNIDRRDKVFLENAIRIVNRDGVFPLTIGSIDAIPEKSAINGDRSLERKKSVQIRADCDRITIENVVVVAKAQPREAG